MQPRRMRVIALGAVLAVVGAIVPLAVMAYASWRIATGTELDALQRAGKRAVARAENTFMEAGWALRYVDASRVEPCSPSHIALMRIATINTDAVSEVGYFDNGRLKCTSWGAVTDTVEHSHVDYITPDGFDVTLRLMPTISIGKPVLGLSLGSHYVLIAPSRFVDVGLTPEVSLALMNTTGLLIDMRNNADIVFAQHRIGGKPSGIEDGRMFAKVEGKGVIAVVTEPARMVYHRLKTELLLLLPVGLFIAAFIVAIVVLLSKRRLSPRAELELAVQNREFVVHYQPIIELATNICVGAEALVRWKRPDGTLVRPDLFIPLAEETGLIKPITDQVVDAVVRELGSLLVEDRGLHVAVNLSAEDIRTGRILDLLVNKLSGTGIRNEQILLEATERGFIDIEAANRTFARARRVGHTVAIDDFGTGYSSLQYLQGLPMDALKIDKSFIDTIGRGTATSSVTLHIIEMARELGFLSVAEGVETEEQADYLRRHGVNFGQGWLFSKPLEAAAFIAFQKEARRRYGAAPEVIRSAA
ncbi:EAL domain-containing protein [Neorhizobium sp. NCHU2750]|uniref:EAL domain-containing protein n=1 Tax=Neorhizobium sp. NCHU2750 TaxID=1825976 RepID=UPI000E73560E|nr:signal peptide protein [Neorhizobium sp. NCHU2750]